MSSVQFRSNLIFFLVLQYFFTVVVLDNKSNVFWGHIFQEDALVGSVHKHKNNISKPQASNLIFVFIIIFTTGMVRDEKSSV